MHLKQKGRQTTTLTSDASLNGTSADLIVLLTALSMKQLLIFHWNKGSSIAKIIRYLNENNQHQKFV